MCKPACAIVRVSAGTWKHICGRTNTSLCFMCLYMCVWVCVWFSFFFNEWIKGEGSLLFNKKCNIVFLSLDNVFWHGTVTRQRDRCKYFGGWQYITITARASETILRFPFYSGKKRCIVNIILSNSFRDSEISRAPLFTEGNWSRLLMRHNYIESCDILHYYTFDICFWTGAKLREDDTDVFLLCV